MFKKTKKKSPDNNSRRRTRQADEARPAAFSYYARRSDEMLGTGRQIARSETAASARAAARYWRQRFGLAVLLVSSLICLIYISTLSTHPRIVITPSPSAKAVLQDKAVYEGAASRIMQSSLFDRNKMTVSTNSLSKQLAAEYPELAGVQVSLPLITHRLTLTLYSTEPVILLATSNGSYALDSNGTALLTGSQLASLSSLNLPLVTDESALKVQLRHQALTSDNVGFILTVLSQLNARKLPAESITLPAGASELDVRLSGQPYFIKFNLASNSSRQQVGTFLAVYDRLSGQGVTPGQYVDVRVDGRAYYK